MRWVIPLLALILLVACSSSSEEAAPTPSPTAERTQEDATPTPGPSPTSQPTTLAQKAYNLYLELARETVADDPELGCDPDTWEEIANNPDLWAAEKELAELAFVDACKEAGELSEVADFSEYYAAAPGRPEDVSPESVTDIPALRQTLYNGYLDASREFVADDPDFACDPLMWDTIIRQLGDMGSADKALAELSLIDACHEAGELSELAEWSDYYENAPEP